MQNELTNNSQTYSTSKLSKYLKICPTTTYKLLKTKGFPSYRSKGHWLVRHNDLNAWIRKQWN